MAKNEITVKVEITDEIKKKIQDLAEAQREYIYQEEVKKRICKNCRFVEMFDGYSVCDNLIVKSGAYKMRFEVLEQSFCCNQWNAK